MRTTTARTLPILFLVMVGLMWSGCRSTYYSMWETLGKEKRHLLRDEVENAREDQAKASEEFKDALTRIKELTGFQGGELENIYLQLKDDYEDCELRASIIAAQRSASSASLKRTATAPFSLPSKTVTFSTPPAFLHSTSTSCRRLA